MLENLRVYHLVIFATLLAWIIPLGLLWTDLIQRFPGWLWLIQIMLTGITVMFPLLLVLRRLEEAARRGGG